MALVSSARFSTQAEVGSAAISFRPLKVVDIHIERPLSTISGLSRYRGVRALVRSDGMPLGWVFVPIHRDRCLAEAQRSAIVNTLGQRLLLEHLENRLAAGLGAPLAIESSDGRRPEDPLGRLTVSVAVCTRDRTESLRLCLESLQRLTRPVLEVIIVDNAPTSDATRRLVQECGGRFRYVHEARPGLDWARNRAVQEARGDVIAFTDDDCVVDEAWADALASTFAEAKEVAAVTGLVVPHELETKAQILFESYGGFGRGFRRRWNRVGPRGRAHVGAGNYGTGANMAFRRRMLQDLGGFDPALDVGTVTNGGGDIEMFFRVLQEGHVLVYEPRAIVRHRHRRDLEALRRQLRDHGIGFSSYATRSVLAYPSQWRSFAWFARWWLFNWILRRLVRALLRPSSFPRALIVTELRGAAIGLVRYRAARRHAQEIGASTTSLSLHPPRC